MLACAFCWVAVPVACCLLLRVLLLNNFPTLFALHSHCSALVSLLLPSSCQLSPTHTQRLCKKHAHQKLQELATSATRACKFSYRSLMTATEGLLDGSHWGLARSQPLRACYMTATQGLQDDSHWRLAKWQPHQAFLPKHLKWRNKWSIHHSIFTAWMKQGPLNLLMPDTCMTYPPNLELHEWSSKHFLIFLFNLKKRLPRSQTKIQLPPACIPAWAIYSIQRW